MPEGDLKMSVLLQEVSTEPQSSAKHASAVMSDPSDAQQSGGVYQLVDRDLHIAS